MDQVKFVEETHLKFLNWYLFKQTISLQILLGLILNILSEWCPFQQPLILILSSFWNCFPWNMFYSKFWSENLINIKRFIDAISTILILILLIVTILSSSSISDSWRTCPFSHWEPSCEKMVVQDWQSVWWSGNWYYSFSLI